MKSSLRHKDRHKHKIIVQASAKSRTKGETKKNSRCFVFASLKGEFILCFRCLCLCRSCEPGLQNEDGVEITLGTENYLLFVLYDDFFCLKDAVLSPAILAS